MEFNRIQAFILILAISAINCAIFNIYSNFDGSESPPSSSLQDDSDLRFHQARYNDNGADSPAASTEYNPLVIPSPSSSTDREPIQPPAAAYISVGRLRELEKMQRMREEKNVCNCVKECLRRRRGSLELPSQQI